MRILAIDPGFERVGIALLEKEKGQKEKLLFSECFKTPKTDLFSKRLLSIHKKIDELCREYKPEILCIESLFLSTNQKTAIRVAEARGVIVMSAEKNGLTIHEYTPLQIKVAVTGYGKSDKEAVMNMVPKIIHMDQKSTSDDELDAIAIGLTGISYLHL